MDYTLFPLDDRTYGFPPLMCDNPRILILGTLPGGESLEHQQYYYSNSNRIWRVLCALTGEAMPLNYQQKQELLARHHVVLWDFYESAIRPGSEDKNLRDGRPNDICGFITANPTIKVIAINGFGKYRKFGERIKRDLSLSPALHDVRVLRLPETSGGNANHGWGVLDNLVREWSKIFE